MFQPIGAKQNKILILVSLAFFFCLLVSSPAFAASPAVGTISPSEGTSPPNTALSFSATYADPDGASDLRYAAFLLHPGSGGNYCLLLYDQPNNLIYLTSDTSSSPVGGYPPGSANTISNDYLSLDLSQTTVVRNGNVLTINWSLTPLSLFSGRLYHSLLLAIDSQNNSTNWTPRGGYIIDYLPEPQTLTPSSGSSRPDEEVEFTASFRDADGSTNLKTCVLAFSRAEEQSPSLFLVYDQTQNLLYLSNDTVAALLGGFSPGQAQTIENSSLKLNCQNSRVTSSEDTLTLTLAVSFKFNQSASLNSYLLARDLPNLQSSWLLKGSWNIQPDTTPPTGTIAVNNNQSWTNQTSATLQLSAADDSSRVETMSFSNDNSSWSDPEPYSTVKSWTLSSEEGEKTVYAKFKDSAGNWSEPALDSISLDTTAPVISLAQVNSPTNQDVTLAYTKEDNLTPPEQILVTGDNSPYTAEGTHNITLTGSDLAGNTSTAETTFTIDKTPPALIITSPEDGSTSDTETITLSGTSDAIPFSETRTLTQEGANLIEKTVTDAAGNSSSVSITVYLQSGQLIGPEGGTVTSGDGKVRVVIPEGALTESVRIKVLNIDQDTLKDNAPQNSSLLNAVECLPYGLIFNQPVSIIYTLTQAEVPGTPVELGLYDAIQDIIIPTGQTSTVPADGYTLTFSIMHFSTYAALKNLTPQSTPIGLGVKIPLPDLLTGAYAHSVPLTVVPGRKGMQPSLGLSYRSSGSNSWVGLGFSLNPGYIVRSTRLGPPSYIDAQDTFYFITDSGTTELVHLIDNLYQAKVESGFTKFFKEPDDSWRVVTKEGAVLRFGQSPDSKENSPSGTFAWYLTKAADTNGNYIAYIYTKDQGKSYLSRIDYTGNEIGTSPANSVTFILEPRDDVSSSYISSARIATAKRLKEIHVKLGLELVWTYTLEYAYSPDTNRSLLTKITQVGSDGQTLPAQQLRYQEAR